MTLAVRVLYIGVLFRFTSQQAVDVLADLKTRRGTPEVIRVDNGPEFRSVAWANGPVGKSHVDLFPTGPAYRQWSD